MKINTYYEDFTREWVAYYDDDEPDDDGRMDRGFGSTEEEAITELKEMYPRGEE
jgi:hypothetical protein